MYFSELLSLTNKKICIQKFIEFASRCSCDFNVNKVIGALNQAIDYMKNLKPVYSDDCMIHIGHDEDYKGIYDYAYMIKKNWNFDDPIYSFEAVPWAEVLGYKVDENELKNYTREYYVMLVLWEMTFFGYDEKVIQNRVKCIFESDDD